MFRRYDEWLTRFEDEPPDGERPRACSHVQAAADARFARERYEALMEEVRARRGREPEPSSEVKGIPF